MNKEKVTKTALIISGALTLIICGVMNFYLIPLIESTTQGVRMFDMNSFGYSFETAQKFISLLSAEGLKTFLNIQLPLDFFYPVAYTVFFTLALKKLSTKKLLLVFPLGLMLCDYAENIMSEIMLRGGLSQSLACAASTVTVCKSILMDITILLVLVFFAIWLLKRRKQKKTA